MPEMDGYEATAHIRALLIRSRRRRCCRGGRSRRWAARPCWCWRSGLGVGRAARRGGRWRWRCCWRSSSTRRWSRRSARRCAMSRSSSSTIRRASRSAIAGRRPKRRSRRCRSGSAICATSTSGSFRAGKAQPGSGDDGTRLFTALTRAMSDVPRQRLAAVVMVTDGQVHDLPAGAPEAAAQELWRAAARSAVGPSRRA